MWCRQAVLTLFVVPVDGSLRLVFLQLRESTRELRELLRPQVPLCVQGYRSRVGCCVLIGPYGCTQPM
jgi:hypothetical protein